LKLDATSPVPLYYQLKETLREEIISGTFKPGNPFPSETLLCEQFEVSRFTVRQAVGDLVREGLLTRQQGKGTFVTAPKIDQDLLGFYSFSREMASKGHSVTGRVLSITKIPPRKRHQHLFSLKEDELVYQVFRLRFVNGEPVILEKIYLPASLCPELEQYDLSSTPQLYKIFHDVYGLELTGVSKALEPSLADQYEASVLGIKPGAAVLLIDRTSHTIGNKVVVLSTWVVRGDRCRHYIDPAVT
jgi:GntR family transcriptional regulator